MTTGSRIIQGPAGRYGVFLNDSYMCLRDHTVFKTVDIYSMTYAILETIEPWSVVYRVFIYNSFIESYRSVLLTQR